MSKSTNTALFRDGEQCSRSGRRAARPSTWAQTVTESQKRGPEVTGGVKRDSRADPARARAQPAEHQRREKHREARRVRDGQPMTGGKDRRRHEPARAEIGSEDAPARAPAAVEGA